MLNLSAIADLPDDTLEQAILDAVADQIARDLPRQYEVVMALPVGYRAVYTTMVLDMEVTNGGFLQYFYNTRGQFADEVLEGLHRIEAPEHAEVFEKALDRIDQEADQLLSFWKSGTLEAFAASYQVSRLPELDRQWFALSNLSTKRVAYIRRSPAGFLLAD